MLLLEVNELTSRTLFSIFHSHGHHEKEIFATSRVGSHLNRVFSHLGVTHVPFHLF